MDEVEHNAPGFYYLVKWRRHDIKGGAWEERVVDRGTHVYTVPDQPIYKPYEIHVLAINEVGEAVLKQKVEVLYSSEDGEYSVCFCSMKGKKVKQHYHIKVNCEMKQDC